jgi:hypothetical protein
MAQDHRKRHRVILAATVCVGLTYAGGDDPDQYLVGPRSLHAHRSQPELAVFLFNDGGFDIQCRGWHSLSPHPDH